MYCVPPVCYSLTLSANIKSPLEGCYASLVILGRGLYLAKGWEPLQQTVKILYNAQVFFKSR